MCLLHCIIMQFQLAALHVLNVCNEMGDITLREWKQTSRVHRMA